MARPTPVPVRDARAGDLDRILELNNAALPAVGELDTGALEQLVGWAHSVLVVDAADRAGGVAAFLLGLTGRGLAYDSPNYAAFSTRHERFAYVDRVVVDPAHQAGGLGTACYDAFVARARADAYPVLCAEVNTVPRNDVSLRFHDRYGFSPVGEQVTEGGAKRVVLLELPL